MSYDESLNKKIRVMNKQKKKEKYLIYRGI